LAEQIIINSNLTQNYMQNLGNDSSFQKINKILHNDPKINLTLRIGLFMLLSGRLFTI